LNTENAGPAEPLRVSPPEAVDYQRIQVSDTDLLDEQAVSTLVKSLPAHRQIDLVQCAGLSAGSYHVPDDNPYLPVDALPTGLPTAEFDVIVRSLLLLVQALIARWRKQPETRVVVVNSMSGIRPYPYGYAHASAKAGLHNAVRSLALELAKDNIFVSEVNPGAVDTGFYDPASVQEAVTTIGREFGYDYHNATVPQMPPSAVGDAVVLCLTSPAHVLSIDAVARGQFPHHGA
ncbi:SDR family oxidoreductase, partial [bacterium]|nr:SDR family oxidoreductase [bacterium]